VDLSLRRYDEGVTFNVKKKGAVEIVTTK
jgi:hypothetical protein